MLWIVGCLILAATALVVFAAWRGWFTLGWKGGGFWSRKRNIELTLDPAKVGDDARKVKNAAAELRD